MQKGKRLKAGTSFKQENGNKTADMLLPKKQIPIWHGGMSAGLFQFKQLSAIERVVNKFLHQLGVFLGSLAQVGVVKTAQLVDDAVDHAG